MLPIDKKILDEIAIKKEVNIYALCEEFNLSHKAIYGRIKRLIQNDMIERIEKGRYRLKYTHYSFALENKDLDESSVWEKSIVPVLPDMHENARRVLVYAFTEMLNNAISHSGAERIGILLSVNAYKVNVAIIDNGIGIFKKIQQALHLDEEYYAVLELAKGKFTTDPDSHTGEGIFFTSKAADEFLILSDGLRFVNDNKKEHRSLLQGIEDVKENSEAAGTIVLIGVLCDHSASLKDVFEEYTQMPEEYGFNKTIVPVKLLGYGEQNPYFVSRSQAKRLLMRFESFENILLDFEGIDEIGQGFADEIFRVFRNQHPNITIKVTNCSQDVMNMIYHVTGGAKL